MWAAYTYICVAQRKGDNSDERVVLFLKMAPRSQFNEDLVTQVKTCIRKYLTVRHVPSVILPCTDIPEVARESGSRAKPLRFCYRYGPPSDIHQNPSGLARDTDPYL
ncbi:hypothetical protein DPMN_103156 [Dreissena polymorpha]|uniref:Uncharacterized protein n=1 Tax=Dreissena polymorpha TaxID=45954 RepID=A0A9D4JYX9_DREPO|nr:hypothetical protein DPMN_103156 [Dreissena polymorpha]